MSTTISGDTGIIFPDSSTQSKAVSQATPFAVTASAIAGAELQLPEATANGVNYVAVKSADALAANLTFTLPAADGTSGQVLQTNGTGALSFTSFPSSVVQYPQNIQSANYTLVLGDAGKQIFHPASDANVRTFTIPSNASVAFPIGTVVLFTVENGGTTVGITITSDTLVYGNGTTGSLSVPANQTLMAIKVTATKWMANYLYQTGTPGFFNAGEVIAVAHETSPCVSVYPWNASTGFGTKFPNPATLPAGANCWSVAFTSAGNAIAVGGGPFSGYITAYPWSGAGFGTKYTNPATLPAGQGQGVAFNPAGTSIAVAHDTAPNVTAYPFNAVTGFGTKYTDPATAVTGNAYAVAFSPAGDAIAVGHDASPYINAYPWNAGTGFGAKYTNPVTLPSLTVQGVAFNPAGTSIAVAHNASPRITAYPWSGSGFGTKYTNPATLPPDDGFGVAFNAAGTSIAVAHASSPFITAYPWNAGTGFGTKYTNPATLPGGQGNGVAFSPTGDVIAVAHNSAPYITAYPWNAGTGFGTKYTNPATLPPGAGFGVAFTTS